MLVIASREYQAAVRTKTFIISLVMLPVLMLGSIVMQWLFHGIVDTKDKKFVLVNHRASTALLGEIESKIAAYNKHAIFDESGRQVKPRLLVARVEPAAASKDANNQQRFDLSEQVRAGTIVGFLEIGSPDKLISPDERKKNSAAQIALRYQSNRPTFNDFSRLVEKVATDKLRDDLKTKDRLDAAQVAALLQPVELESKGLMRRDASGAIVEGSEQSRFVPLVVSGLLMLLMFMVLMMTATPMMQSVVEEKMQRIAEVLLGSVPPFELMLGKLIGMVGVSLTIAAFYLAGAYWAAFYFHVAEDIPLELLLWFVLLQALAGLMYGSLFIAIGAACTDMKETQNLMWPVMLLVCFPLFLLGSILQEPHSAVARGLSLFPFATPTLMVARLAAPPGLPWWEPALGVFLVLITTLVCVYAAGRIFRVGILLQGKGAKPGEIMKWVIRG
jgi:ABC-2 type transport system permease protein